MSFVVTFAPHGKVFIVRVPSFGLRFFVDEEADIPEKARQKIAACGSAPKTFEIEVRRHIPTPPDGLRLVE